MGSSRVPDHKGLSCLKMWQQKVFEFTVYVLVAQAMAEQQQQRQLNNEQDQQQQVQVNLNAWEPLTGHNNWLILQATAATTIQQRLHPVNYYAYNHRYKPSTSLANGAADGATPDGNYKQLRPSQLNDSPSYVLAISQALPQAEQSGAIVNEGPRRQLPPPGLKDLQEVNMRDGHESLESDKDVVGIKASSTSLLDINNYLDPFEQAVLKVRDFCDTLRSIISDSDEQDEQEQEQTEHRSTDANTGKLEMVNTLPTSMAVQGRSSRLASSSQGRKVKKLKRKIQKLLLPLLIAYKLKFLTLIPVLIGGLTLLVGTTGLAGFFFALFTAVMSLKSSTSASHGSKAIIFKKF